VQKKKAGLKKTTTAGTAPKDGEGTASRVPSTSTLPTTLVVVAPQTTLVINYYLKSWDSPRKILPCSGSTASPGHARASH